MTAEPPDQAAPSVLGRYPAPLRQGTLVALGNRGGFSGAALWRLDGPAGSLCLRAAPPTAVDPDRLAWVHRLMALARREGLAFVPAVLAVADGRTWVERAGRLWELMEWMPGRAAFHERPTEARLEAACVALARLHTCWERAGASSVGTCPAVRRRLETLAQIQALALPDDLSLSKFDATCRAVARRLGDMPRLLQPWAQTRLALQPCLCDVWHDHLLYEGERLTGLIDYGAVRVDHAAVDLARLLGSLVGDDPSGWRAGLAAYRAERRFTDRDEQLARVLDVTGTVLGAANWLRWLSDAARQFENRRAAVSRLEALLRRIERWGNEPD